MDSAAVRSEAEVARRKVNRASGLLRDASRALAALAGEQDTVGVLRAHDGLSIADARELIEVGVARHGAVDVVVVARPTGRVATPPQRDSAKENHNGTHSGTASRSSGGRSQAGVGHAGR